MEIRKSYILQGTVSFLEGFYKPLLLCLNIKKKKKEREREIEW